MGVADGSRDSPGMASCTAQKYTRSASNSVDRRPSVSNQQRGDMENSVNDFTPNVFDESASSDGMTGSDKRDADAMGGPDKIDSDLMGGEDEDDSHTMGGADDRESNGMGDHS